MRAGLLGRKLGHSFSPKIHSHLGDYSYELFEVEPENLDHFILSGKFDGLNVTIPYKREVMPYCAELSDAARKIGSVNTLVRRPNGTLFGDNTDAAGFEAMLRRLKLHIAGKKALVLGSGGASLTVQYVLRSYGAEVVVISRSGKDNYQNLEHHADARILVNATPVGTYPDCESSPLSLDALPHLEAVLDLIYNPARTRLLLDAQKRGIPCMGGLVMLVEQARAAAERFTGEKIPPERTEELVGVLSSETQNIVLIGMPGCGKSTVGALLARKLGRPFLDTDQLFVQRTGTEISQYFCNHSEAEFRAIEHEVIAQACKGSGAVIATGGGCVTYPDNLDCMRQNSLIFYLERDLHLLPTEGRPLSQSNSLETLYQQRLPLYRLFSDASVKNMRAPEDAAAQILEEFYEILGA